MGAKTQKLDTKLGTDLTFPAGTLIVIDSYDEKSQTYEVSSVTLPGEDASIATPEGVALSVEAVDINRLLRSPNSIVGSQYQIKKPLRGLTDKELAARIKNLTR